MFADINLRKLIKTLCIYLLYFFCILAYEVLVSFCFPANISQIELDTPIL